jgi:glycogen debranching enzyme
MHDLIEVENQYYIRAQSSLADDRRLVLTRGDTFAVFDRYGDVQPIGVAQHGLFHQETRYISKLGLRIDGKRPLLLSSAIREDNVVLAVDLTNPDLEMEPGVLMCRGTVHIHRTKFLLDTSCFERILLRNYGLAALSFDLSLEFSADFADIFEVRGHVREKKGVELAPELREFGATLSYEGLDHIIRRTRIRWSPRPTSVASSLIRFSFHLEPKAEQDVEFVISCEGNGTRFIAPGFSAALAKATTRLQCPEQDEVVIRTSNEQFNEWLNRSRADLRMMITSTPFGPYPYAGVPWFNTVFGRDGIITALECLWFDPWLAKGVLSYLANTQAQTLDAERDAEPGKILHETRKGEMAGLGEVPFGRYYGSVDATPLFVLLAAAYYERTADLEFLRSIWPNIEAALDWIDHFGDQDGDGFVEYSRQSSKGLAQQGWKDSHDSVFHADGNLAEGPIALCEVQAYVYAAKRGIATAAGELGFSARARQLAREASDLQSRFQANFWCDELSMYVLALDGSKRHCKVRSSNAGQCLFSGIASQADFQRTVSSLSSDAFFSGWGVRTIAESEQRYNPMSYHNGSVWPHDNALIAFGLIRARDKELATKILNGLFDVSTFLELYRLPELICGFTGVPASLPQTTRLLALRKLGRQDLYSFCCNPV